MARAAALVLLSRERNAGLLAAAATWALVAAVGRAVAPELLSREWIPGLVVAAVGSVGPLVLLSREMSPV